MCADVSVPDQQGRDNPTNEPQFYCTYCRATRECISCAHNRHMADAEAEVIAEQRGEGGAS